MTLLLFQKDPNQFVEFRQTEHEVWQDTTPFLRPSRHGGRYCGVEHTKERIKTPCRTLHPQPVRRHTLSKSVIRTHTNSTNRPANTTTFFNLGLQPIPNPFHIPNCDISLYCGPSNPEKRYPRLLVGTLMNEAFTKINTELEHGGDRPVSDRYLEFDKAGVELAIRTPGVVGALGQILYSELGDMLRGFGLKLSREGTIMTRCIYYWDGQYPPVMGGVDLKGW